MLSIAHSMATCCWCYEEDWKELNWGEDLYDSIRQLRSARYESSQLSYDHVRGSTCAMRVTCAIRSLKAHKSDQPWNRIAAGKGREGFCNGVLALVVGS